MRIFWFYKFLNFHSTKIHFQQLFIFSFFLRYFNQYSDHWLEFDLRFSIFILRIDLYHSRKIHFKQFFVDQIKFWNIFLNENFQIYEISKFSFNKDPFWTIIHFHIFFGVTNSLRFTQPRMIDLILADIFHFHIENWRISFNQGSFSQSFLLFCRNYYCGLTQLELT